MSVDLVRLRNVLGPPIVGHKEAGTHEMLPSICTNLGLPSPDNNVLVADPLTPETPLLRAAREQATEL